MRCCRLIVSLWFLTVLPLIAADEAPRKKTEPPMPESAPAKPAAEKNEQQSAAAVPPRSSPVWLDTLAKGYAAARVSGKPLFVITGAPWCEPCRELEKALKDPSLRDEFDRWTLVSLDVDKSKEDAISLAIERFPSLHVFTLFGKQVAIRYGKLKADELEKWLGTHYEAAHWVPPKDLAENGPVTAEQLPAVIAYFSSRDATTREAAIRRLIPYPDVAAVAVVETFSDGKLAARLTAMELLVEWKAPLQGIDPWRRESIDREKLKKLSAWSSHPKAPAQEPRPPLTAAELQEAGELISRMITVDPVESAAIRERLARYGSLLLPVVKKALQRAETDEARERLVALRYRLVIPASLVLQWPGGVERLASNHLETRRAAAEELANRATEEEEPLLRELFSDAAPIIREISLKALRKAGGANARAALLELLVDPEPNVRAAVLKELSEHPPENVLPQILEYISVEQDPDLLVHAIRVLRESKTPAATKALLRLFEHDSWRVRAEAAEAVSKTSANAGDRGEITAALIKLLSDKDGFVVSRAMQGLAQSEKEGAVDALAAAAEKHPELTKDVLQIMSNTYRGEGKGGMYVRRYLQHPDVEIRTWAVRGFITRMPYDTRQEVMTALSDPISEIRIAAATALFENLNFKLGFMRGLGDFDLKGELEQRRIAAKANPTPPPAPVPSAPSPALTPAQRERQALRQAQGMGPIPAALPSANATPDRPDKNSAKNPPASLAAGNGAAVKPGSPAKEDVASSSPQAPKKLSIEELADPSRPFSQAERTVRGLRIGQGLMSWMFSLREPLLPLVKATDARERLAAAIALVALGRDEESIPVLHQELPTGVESRLSISQVLPWLMWEDRIVFYRKLKAASADASEAAGHLEMLAKLPDQKLVPFLWETLGNPEIDDEIAGRILQYLRREYFGESRNSTAAMPAEIRQFVEREAVPHAKAGTPWQRLAALHLLTQIDQDQVVELAAGISADKQAGIPLRRSALAIVLATQKPAKSTRLAVDALAGPTLDNELRKLCLSYLAQGSDALAVQNALQWSLGNSRKKMQPRNPVVVETEAGSLTPPAGLSTETLLPLLKDGDQETVALAGYLLALQERPEGLPPLLTYWRKQGRQAMPWKKLVYRAIAALNDISQSAALQQIYETMSTNAEAVPGRAGGGEVSEFYWTIRNMTGPDVLKLRKKIRDDVGMEHLQR